MDRFLACTFDEIVTFSMEKTPITPTASTDSDISTSTAV
jgi:hypothetical protein